MKPAKAEAASHDEDEGRFAFSMDIPMIWFPRHPLFHPVSHICTRPFGEIPRLSIAVSHARQTLLQKQQPHPGHDRQGPGKKGLLQPTARPLHPSLKLLATGSGEERLLEAGLHKARRFTAFWEAPASSTGGLGRGFRPLPAEARPLELGMAAVSRLDVSQCAPLEKRSPGKPGECESRDRERGGAHSPPWRARTRFGCPRSRWTPEARPLHRHRQKVILAHLGRSNSILPARGDPQAAHSAHHHRPRPFVRTWRRVRSRGYSVDDEEISRASAAWRLQSSGLDGRVVARSVAGPTNRMPKDACPRFASRVVTVAGEISRNSDSGGDASGSFDPAL